MQKITYSDNWGYAKASLSDSEKKQLVFYHLFEHELEGEAIAKLELDMKRDEKIMRFLTVRMDKHSIAFAESRPNRGNGSPKKGGG